jgi:malate synthase
VLIETLPAAFEMDEILYELRQVGAACVDIQTGPS